MKATMLFRCSRLSLFALLLSFTALLSPVRAANGSYQGGQVSRFSLMNAATDTVIEKDMGAGPYEIDLAITGYEINICARRKGGERVGSIVFDLDGQKGFSYDNWRPYGLRGTEATRGDRFPPISQLTELGMHTITATPYEGRDGTGDAGNSRTIEVVVIDSSTTASPTPRSTKGPTALPSSSPTSSPTSSLSSGPTTAPTALPTSSPTASPSDTPSDSPSTSPTASPSDTPSDSPSASPTASPVETPPPPSGTTDVPAYKASMNGSLSGELRKWHKITLGFHGPNTNEWASTNPFTYYRLDCTFRHSGSGQEFVVPGYYAADGNAANTQASSGKVWLCHFSPKEEGAWTWEASFKKGNNVAQNGGGSSAGYFDNKSGSFVVSETNKQNNNGGRDHRGKGRLEYVGKHHLQFAETGEYFLKAGVDSPENFLAYDDFDNTSNFKKRRKSWASHVRDWRDGDPTFGGEKKGKGIIGAVNYLALEKGMNVFSFITMNIKGDDRNVFPYVDKKKGEPRLRMDVSKLAQWEVLLEHADHLGMYMHFKLQEYENHFLLDRGELGDERRLYYREMVARFGHHLALNWNLGEESINTDEQRKSFMDYIKSIDPYDHPVVVHTIVAEKSQVYTPLLGRNTMDGTSLQCDFDTVFADTLDWVKQSAATGRKWVVSNDEQGPYQIGVRPDDKDADHDDIRKQVLWGNIMAGGAGVEYYFGSRFKNSDMSCQDFRTRSIMFDQSRHALDFFHKNDVPFWDMVNENDHLGSSNDTNWCLAQNNNRNVIVVYLVNGGTDSINLDHNYESQWYNPKQGGALMDGLPLAKGNNQSLGNPPGGASTGQDWVVLLTKA